MENPSNQENQRDKIIPQSTDEIEFLNDSDELDDENLEEIQGGGCGLRFGCGTKNAPKPEQ